MSVGLLAFKETCGLPVKSTPKSKPADSPEWRAALSYWKTKIARNQERDRAHLAALAAMGWRVLIVWECALKARALDAVADDAAEWVRSGRDLLHVIPREGTANP